MFLQHRRSLANLMVFAQVALTFGLFWILFSAFAFVSPLHPQNFIHSYAFSCAAIAIGLLLERVRREPDQFFGGMDDVSLVPHLPLALRQLAFALSSLMIMLVSTQDHSVSRRFILLFAVAFYPLLVWTSARLPPYLVRSFFSGQRNGRTLLVGPPERAVRLAGWLRRKSQFGWNLCGFVSTSESPVPSTNGIPILGSLSQIEEILDQTEALQVILLDYGAPDLARSLISRCQRRGARLFIVNDVAEQLRHPTVCFQDEGLNIIALREEPLENPFNRLLKRMLDLLIAIPTAVIALPPLMAIVWLLQRLQSPGPLWHRQKRAGLQNRSFKIFKFRTMHPHHGSQAKQATVGDARIYPAGRWLRRFSLDEIPQCLNVIRGEMSIVGPRPHLPEHNAQFARELANYHIRSLIKPGITGLAQVRGFRGEARTPQDIAARLSSDLVYLENWSLALELGILIRTVWQLFRPPPTAV